MQANNLQRNPEQYPFLHTKQPNVATTPSSTTAPDVSIMPDVSTTPNVSTTPDVSTTPAVSIVAIAQLDLAQRVLGENRIKQVPEL